MAANTQSVCVMDAGCMDERSEEVRRRSVSREEESDAREEEEEEVGSGW